MFKQYYRWHNDLIPLKRWFVSFMINWIYWLFAWLILEQFFYDEKQSWKYILGHTKWMSLIMTGLFKWKDLKQIFNTIHPKSNNKK